MTLTSETIEGWCGNGTFSISVDAEGANGPHALD